LNRFNTVHPVPTFGDDLETLKKVLDKATDLGVSSLDRRVEGLKERKRERKRESET